VGAAAATAGRERGREAQRPTDIPRPGWRDIALRVKREVAKDRLSIISAGVAFYGMLAALPALGALISIYGLLFDPQQVMDQITAMRGVMPGQAVDLIVQQLQELAKADTKALGLGVAGGVLLALWSASAGVRTMMEALNVAYEEKEKRGFLERTALSLLLTLATVLIGAVAVATVVLLPAVIDFLGLGGLLEGVVYYVRWPILAVVFWFGLMVMYRYGPSRDHPQWAWVSPGGIIVTVLWIGGSVLFSWYVENFGNYNKTYGSMGAVVILLMWLLLSAYVVLIGAEINAETERQTRKDTTVDEPQPLGRRGAYAADTVGESPGR
jgi:membrane protein